MADYLINFIPGEKIKASEVNSNFQYLLDRISDNAETLRTYLEQQIGMINSNIDSKISTLNVKIDNLSSKLDSTITNLSKIYTAIAPNYAKGVNISSGWTANNNGWINWNGSTIGDGTTAKLYINGIEIGLHSYYKYGDAFKTQFFINKGEKVTFTKGTSAVFYPCKGGL